MLGHCSRLNEIPGRLMSEFLSDLRMTMLRSSDGFPLQNAIGRQLYMLDAPLGYQSDIADADFVVPEGFVTDLSSIPRLPLIYVLLDGDSDMPAVIHDYLYNTGKLSRKLADAVLREACIAIGLPRWKVESIYLGVRIGGSNNYVSYS